MPSGQRHPHPGAAPRLPQEDDRIRAHAFLCMLSYHLLWHAKRRLAPLLEAAPSPDGWTLDLVWETLKSLHQQRVNAAETEFKQLTEPTAEQTQLLKLPGVTLPSPAVDPTSRQ